MNNQGTNGNYWSSSPNGTNGYNLNFKSSNINTSNNTNRANGLTLRCIKNYKKQLGIFKILHLNRGNFPSIFL